jgi:hypothetical protein
MDLSVYISELLFEQGEINIPQIGVFKQVRMRGYFNADEGKLYPPYYQTEFEYKQVEDDSLLRYIVSKSKISATSAKYFMDKYLFNILQQAEIGEVMLGRLGWVSKEGNELRFRPAADLHSNPSVFGFAPVSINTHTTEQEQTVEAAPPIAKQTEPVVPIVYSVEKAAAVSQQNDLPKPATSPLLRQPKQEIKSPEPALASPAISQLEQTTPVKEPEVLTPISAPSKQAPFYSKPWFFAIVAGIILIAIIAVLYPKTTNTIPVSKPAESQPTPSMDSVIITKPAAPDTAAKTQVAPVTDTAAHKPLPASTEFAPQVETPAAPTLVNTENFKFVLMSGAFSNAVEANKVVNRYKAIGVNAAILKNVSPSKYVKVTLGFFKTYAEGQAAKIRLVKLKHLRSSDLYVETLRTKRK